MNSHCDLLMGTGIPFLRKSDEIICFVIMKNNTCYSFGYIRNKFYLSW